MARFSAALVHNFITVSHMAENPEQYAYLQMWHNNSIFIDTQLAWDLTVNNVLCSTTSYM